MGEGNLTLTCSQCGAGLAFAPGVQSLQCSHCGTLNAIEVRDEAIEELDLERFLAEQAGKEATLEVVTVRCGGCGASSTLEPHGVSGTCPFCGNPLVVASGTPRTLLKPRSLLPFAIDRKAALERLHHWLKGLWFAPFGFRKAHTSVDRFSGVYIPYWTFDARTESDYSGERGDAYYTAETFTTQENGRAVTRTRQVRHIRWSPASGQVSVAFDDVLVLASHSLPDRHTAALEPWDLERLVPFDEAFLAGFRAEAYQVPLDQGFGQAREVMKAPIAQAVQRDIGGDEQRIHALDTRYSGITFKHILLPVWISAYRYQDRVFRFLVNGRTGEVQGERPYSAIKIALAVLALLGLAGLGWLYGS